VQQAEVCSRITHQHRWAQTICAVYVVTARSLLAGAQPAEALAESLATLREAWTNRLPRPDSVAALDLLEAHSERTGRTFVIDSFWSAWDAFTGAASYEDTIRRAIRYGHDTDTTAAIAGGLAGIYWGIGGIPQTWLARMRGHAIADPLVKALVATVR